MLLNARLERFALQVQELLLQPSSSSAAAAALRRASHVLRPSHFDAVVTERAHERRCGWPACTERLVTPGTGSVGEDGGDRDDEGARIEAEKRRKYRIDSREIKRKKKRKEEKIHEQSKMIYSRTTLLLPLTCAFSRLAT